MSTRRTIALACAGLVLALGVAPTAAFARTPGPVGPGFPSVRPPVPVPPAPPTGTYPLTAGERGTLVLETQQRLLWMGYTSVRLTSVMDGRTQSAVIALRDKFFEGTSPTVTRDLMVLLRQLTKTNGVLPARCRTVLVICIVKTQKLARLGRNNKVVVVADARFGSESNPTYEGTFQVTWKDRDHTSSLYHTWMPLALFFNGGEAVHFSPYFKAVGYYGHSHGCVNIRDWSKATAFFDNTPVGTTVVVYHS